MWDLPGSGIEPVSPALAGGFFATEPPGKPSQSFSLSLFFFKLEAFYFVLGYCQLTGFPGGSAVKNLPAVQEPQETRV